MKPDDDKPLTPAQARQKLQKGLEDYLAGNDTGPIVFRLKRTKKASHTYPLKLTQQQRETLLEHTHLSGKLKKKIEQAGEGTQIVPVTWNELHKLNDETGQAAVYARSPHKKRLLALMSRVQSKVDNEGTIFEKIDILNKALKQEGLDLVIFPGAELHLNDQLLHADVLKESRMLTLNGNKKYILLEFSFQWVPPEAEQIIFALKTMGFTPILPHLERNFRVQNNLVF